MPAAAVIPAPIAYIKVVAVKKLVVGSRRAGGGSLFDATAPFVRDGSAERPRGALDRVSRGAAGFTLKKLECSRQACARPDSRAWNDGIGRRFYFVGLRKST